MNGNRPIASREDAARFLELLARPGDVFELRGLAKGRSSPQVTAGYFDDMTKLAAAAVERSGKDDGVYITLNPVMPALLARAPANRVRQAGNGDTTSDRDVLRRRHLLIDVDPVRPTGISSTEEEHAAAIALATEIAAYLWGLGWPAPILADSGNGGHLIYGIDLPVDDSGLIKRVLAKLSALHTTPAMKVDEKVFNPARISKIYGTLTRKGEDTADRPHRLSCILRAPDQLLEVTRDQLEALAGMASPAPTATSSPRTSTTLSYSDRAKFDLDGWLGLHLPDAVSQSWSGGRKWLLPVCPFNGSHDRKEAFVVEKHGGEIAAGCQHESCFKSWRELRLHFEPDAYRAPINGDRRVSHREPPPFEVEDRSEHHEPFDAESEIEAFASRDREPVNPIVKVELVKEKPRRGRQWGSVVEEIYRRADEPWISIGLDGVEIAKARQGSFITVIAPSGAGKSSLTLQMLTRHARDIGPAIYVTLELDADEAGARIIGQWHGASWMEALTGKVDRNVAPDLPRLDILDRDDASLVRLVEAVEAMRAEYPGEPILVAWDHMQASPDAEDERMRVAKLSTGLRRSAKALGVLILGVSQSSRDGATKLRSGEMSGVGAASAGAESAQIERDSYLILTLGDEQRRDDGTSAWALSTAKHRMGVADVVTPVVYDGRTGGWRVIGDARPASDARAEKAAKGDTAKVLAKLETLGRAIHDLVSKSNVPLSKKEITLATSGNNCHIAAAITRLMIAEPPVLVYVSGPSAQKVGGSFQIWTPERATVSGLTIVPRAVNRDE